MIAAKHSYMLSAMWFSIVLISLVCFAATDYWVFAMQGVGYCLPAFFYLWIAGRE